VGLGDINNDGLLDLYFCGNMTPSKLYLNKGNFQFEDITAKAGVACEGSWATGASFADLNGDGLLDLYVCKSGKPEGRRRFNELFINNGDLTFTEKAAEYGLDDKGFSTHAAFFDYDKDGDLDCYLLNNSFRPIGGFDLRPGQRLERDSLGGNKLYRNDGARFTDVSEQAGIYGSIIGFGLGVTVGDVNRDGWQDIYVSNDFFERDYLYINQKDGTFAESLETSVRELSAASMGADMADLNNDGYPEIFVTDMLPERDARMKTKTTFEDWHKYRANLLSGYYHQFTRNALQLNRGHAAGDSSVYFSEISRMAGVQGTDWSWGALIMDLDNDGLKDIFVANGIYQDLTDQDFLLYASDPRVVSSVVNHEKKKVDFKKLIELIPSQKIPNYLFQNQGNMGFRDQAAAWGLGEPSFSNGAAYGDLDNDGDLDLVVNNCNMPAWVYRNESDSLSPGHHWLQFSLKGLGANTAAIGTQISAYAGGQEFFVEQMPMRGFQSTVDGRPHLGLGQAEKADSILVRWPDGRITRLREVPANQLLALDQREAQAGSLPALPAAQSRLFRPAQAPPFLHRENDFIDFNRDRLIYHMLSAEGPRMAVGDVNGDGTDDVYIGNAMQAPGTLLLQQGGSFRAAKVPAIAADSASEDVGATFFDADGDGDLDLYVVSGGNELPSSSTLLLDRLYINQKGRWEKSPQPLPSPIQPESGSVARPADYDGDGDLDLFVGVRLRPFLYGPPPSSYLLQNDGKGRFRDVSAEAAPMLKDFGMVTCATWADLDQDQDLDLIVSGEYMPIRILINEKGSFTDRTKEWGLEKSNGYWNTLIAADLDGDGDLDLAGGNHGLNSRFKASPERPVCMHVNDFDRNGTAEQIICVYEGDRSYPLALRHDLVAQIPMLKKKYLKYEAYKNQTIEDIFTPEQRQNMLTLYAYELRSCVFLQEGGKFRPVALPAEAQLAPVYAILSEDFDRDGHRDLLLGGNFLRARPEAGGYQSSYGCFLRGDGKGGFTAIDPAESGFFLTGEVRDMAIVRRGNQAEIWVVRNNAAPMIFAY
jgi:hypothetical protein